MMGLGHFWGKNDKNIAKTVMFDLLQTRILRISGNFRFQELLIF